jgi:hypothetical protein
MAESLQVMPKTGRELRWAKGPLHTSPGQWPGIQFPYKLEG